MCLDSRFDSPNRLSRIFQSSDCKCKMWFRCEAVKPFEAPPPPSLSCCDCNCYQCCCEPCQCDCCNHCQIQCHYEPMRVPVCAHVCMTAASKQGRKGAPVRRRCGKAPVSSMQRIRTQLHCYLLLPTTTCSSGSQHQTMRCSWPAASP